MSEGGEYAPVESVRLWPPENRNFDRDILKSAFVDVVVCLIAVCPYIRGLFRTLCGVSDIEFRAFLRPLFQSFFDSLFFPALFRIPPPAFV